MSVTFSLRNSIAALALLCVSLAAIPASAQYRASLQGTVTDPQKAVVPGATVTLTDKETNRTLETVTNEAGVYVFNALAARTYTLSVELAGFKKNVLDDVKIIAEQSNALNVELELGQTNEVVTVGAAAPLIDTATGNISGTITAQHLQTLPSFGRDPLQLLQLAPGAFGDGARAAGGGTQNLPATTIGGGAAAASSRLENGGQIVANGARTAENNYQIDGVGVTSVSWGGTTVITPNEDSIKEIKVVTNNYDAENGRYRGAQVQMISQNGTNQLHGSAFFKWDRPGLNAFQKYNGYGKAVQKNTSELQRLRWNGGRPNSQGQTLRVLLVRNDSPPRVGQSGSGLVPDAAIHGDRGAGRQCRRTVPDLPRIISDRRHRAHGRGRRPRVR